MGMASLWNAMFCMDAKQYQEETFAHVIAWLIWSTGEHPEGPPIYLILEQLANGL